MKIHKLQNYEKVVAINKHVRNMGIEESGKKLAIELYSGRGVLTELYKENFNEVITNDSDKTLPAMYHEKVINFLEDQKDKLFLDKKVDLIDFDAWGCPSKELIYFISNCHIQRHLPLIINYTDGLGFWLKRSKNEKTIREKYMLPTNYEINWFRLWDRHPDLVSLLFKSLSKQFDFQSRCIIAVQSPNKNYTLASYELYK